MPLTEQKKSKLADAAAPFVSRSEIALAAVPVIALAAFYIFVNRPGFADGVVKWFGLPVRRFLGSLCAAAPFSVMEVMYAVLGVWALYFIIKTIVLLFKREYRWRRFFKRVFILALVAAWIFCAFCYLWGADYRAASFAERSGADATGPTVEELTAVTAFFAEKASAASDSVPRDAEGRFSVAVDEIIPAYASIYDGVFSEFPFLRGKINTPKRMVASTFMSRIGFTGVYFPFTGETNLNVDMPRCLLPLTLAHELAHQLGVAAEQECNFLGVAACVSSGNETFEYSGWLAGLLYTSNALYEADYDAWHEIYLTYSEGVRRDFDDNNEYWAKWESPVSTAAETAYDEYLKAQGQALGIRSYGACVDLLTEYFLPYAQ